MTSHDSIEPQRFGVLCSIGYELWMMNATARRMLEETGDDVVMIGALSTAHAMHLRNVVEFLFDKSGPELRARDLTPEWRESKSQAIGRAYGRICEDFAHLSRRRLTAKDITIHDPALVAELLSVVERWLSLLPVEQQRLVRDYRQ